VYLGLLACGPSLIKLSRSLSMSTASSVPPPDSVADDHLVSIQYASARAPPSSAARTCRPVTFADPFVGLAAMPTILLVVQGGRFVGEAAR
jgi:hypothetical protein